MHEWALAESIISTAVEVAEKEHLTTITDITVHIGELQQIEHDIFRFALKELTHTQSQMTQHTRFHLKTEKATFTCTICGHAWSYQEMKQKLSDQDTEDIHFIPEIVFVHTRCPRCNSPDFQITTGRGVTLSTIKGTR